jgi:hypothetical protein
MRQEHAVTFPVGTSAFCSQLPTSFGYEDTLGQPVDEAQHWDQGQASLLLRQPQNRSQKGNTHDSTALILYGYRKTAIPWGAEKHGWEKHWEIGEIRDFSNS